jgi:hypothetical protein
MIWNTYSILWVLAQVSQLEFSDRMNRHLYQAVKRRCLMENAAEGTREYLNWPEGLYPPPPPIDPEEDVCFLSTGVTDDDWKFGSD